MPEKIRFGVIGAGGIGSSHLRSLNECANVAVVALAESSPHRLKSIQETFPALRGYSDYRELLDQSDIDAVTIALPNYLHASATIEALQAGKHVLLEKPMATNYGDALKIAEAVNRTGRTFMLAQNFRFNRFTQAAKQIISRGDLGQVYQVRGFWLRRWGIPRIGSWFTQKKLAGGGCTYDLGVHVLDLCFHLLGDFAVASVSGQIHSQFGQRGLGEMDWGKSDIAPGRPFDVEDYSLALVKMKSGASVAIEISWAAHQEKTEREMGVDLYGSEAGLSLFPAKLRRQGAAGYETIELTAANMELTENRIHYFVNCLAEGKSPIVTLDESLAVQRVLDGIYRSAGTGREVRLDE